MDAVFYGFFIGNDVAICFEVVGRMFSDKHLRDQKLKISAIYFKEESCDLDMNELMSEIDSYLCRNNIAVKIE